MDASASHGPLIGPSGAARVLEAASFTIAMPRPRRVRTAHLGGVRPAPASRLSAKVAGRPSPAPAPGAPAHALARRTVGTGSTFRVPLQAPID